MMNENFLKVKDFLTELSYEITHENGDEGIFVVNDESAGLNNLVVGIAEPLIIFEQFLFEISAPTTEVYQELLKKNRDIIHGAFVLDDTGKKVIFRDTLQIENLDRNEIEASINSLSLLLSEYSDELIKFSHIN